MSCKIVCPLACRNCAITPCEDRMADEANVVNSAIDEYQHLLPITKEQEKKAMRDEPGRQLGRYEVWIGGRTGPLLQVPDSWRVKKPAHIEGVHPTRVYADEIYEGKGFDDRTEDIKDAEALHYCGMRSDLTCRICHDDTCRVRKAPRTF
jgi:hypothetical protein